MPTSLLIVGYSISRSVAPVMLSTCWFSLLPTGSDCPSLKLTAEGEQVSEKNGRKLNAAQTQTQVEMTI